MKLTYEDYRDEVRQYFVCCPFCGSDRLDYVASGPAGHLRLLDGKDMLTCGECGAKWLLYFRLGFLQGYLEWAKLEIESKDGKGLELVGKEIRKDDWREMALETRRKKAK
jgi:hypothetical protein